jgi:16S rRNA processing protein RimM
LEQADFIKIGRVLKTFGTSGDLRCQLGAGFEQILKKDRFVFVKIDGLMVPFYIRKMEYHHKPLIAFADINNEEQASQLSSQWMYINPRDYPNQLIENDLGDSLEYSFLVGYQVFIKNSDLSGQVESVAQYPGQEMAFVAIQKLAGKEIMIPLVNEFLLEIDEIRKSILFELPEGLLDAQIDGDSDDFR